jgi:hypothetical protein
MASGVFGRPAWTPEKCQERASQIHKIAQENDVDPMWFVAINIQECDMREDVDAKVFAPAIAKRPPKQIGADLCPMGIRFLWPNGKRPDKSLDALAIYELAGKKMARWKRWCDKKHKNHSFVVHWNEGNPIYAAQVLAFRTVLMGQSLNSDDNLTGRTKEIVRRLRRAQRDRRS